MAAEHVLRIGTRIKQRREELQAERGEKEFTQAACAARLPGNVGGDQWSRWERGAHRPSDETLELIAEILEVDYSYFVKPDAPDKTETPDLIGRMNEEMSQLDKIERCVVENSETLDRLYKAVEELTAIVAKQAVELKGLSDAADRASRAQGRGGSQGTQAN